MEGSRGTIVSIAGVLVKAPFTYPCSSLARVANVCLVPPASSCRYVPGGVFMLKMAFELCRRLG